MRSAHLTAALLLAACAAAPERNALQQLVGADASSYSLVGNDNGIARFERTVGKEGAVTRTQMAVCRSADNAWRCRGPFDAARVSTPKSVQRLAAAREIDDATLQRVVAYVESECLSRHLTGIGRIPDRRVTAVEHEAGYYEVALGGPFVVSVLMLERADDACGFELRRHRRITLD